MDLGSAFGYAVRAEKLFRLGNLQAALPLALKSVELDPTKAAYYNNVGMIQCDLGDLPSARLACDKAIILDQHFKVSYYNRGVVADFQGHTAEASEYYSRAICCDSEYVDAHVGLAGAQLTLSNYELGWQEYEWRLLRDGEKESDAHILSTPVWSGERDSVVLVYAEQGAGDSIQFVRYVHLLSTEYNCKVYVEIQKPLVRLVRTLPYIEHVFCSGDDVPDDIQYVVPLLSLPRILKLYSDEMLLSVAIPYLSVSSHDTRIWKQRLSGSDNLQVGLCWSGGTRLLSAEIASIESKRNIWLKQLSVLGKLKNCKFISLQVGLASIQKYGVELDIVDFTDHLTDFYDTAALISCLDVVVTVDTAVTHIAGALGKPVFLLNRFDTCWRWQRDRSDSCYYPTLRLFRQPEMFDWQSPILAVRDALGGFRV